MVHEVFRGFHCKSELCPILVVKGWQSCLLQYTLSLQTTCFTHFQLHTLIMDPTVAFYATPNCRRPLLLNYTKPHTPKSAAFVIEQCGCGSVGGATNFGSLFSWSVLTFLTLSLKDLPTIQWLRSRGCPTLKPDPCIEPKQRHH